MIDLGDPWLNLTPAARRSIGRAAFRRWTGSVPGGHAAWIAAGVLLGVGLLLFRVALGPQPFLGPVLLFAGLTGAILAVILLFRRFGVTALAAELRTRGIDVCHRCGHPTGHDAGARCPECGADRSEAPPLGESSEDRRPVASGSSSD